MRKLYHEHSLNSFQCLNMNRKKLIVERPEVAVCLAQEPCLNTFLTTDCRSDQQQQQQKDVVYSINFS